MRIVLALCFCTIGLLPAEEKKPDAKEYYRKGEAEKKLRELETAVTASRLRLKTEEGKRDQEKKNAQKFVKDLADKYYLHWHIYQARWIEDPWEAYQMVRSDIERKEKASKGSSQTDLNRFDEAMAEYRKKYDAFEMERAKMQAALEKSQQEFEQQKAAVAAIPAASAPVTPPAAAPNAPAVVTPQDPAAAPASAADPPAKKKNVKIFVLTDGTKLESSMAMDMGEAWAIKDAKGKMHNIAKDKIEKIEEPE